ncbi:hypothetical protein M997_1871 [Proteus hauseri ATCC 700826]|uniref:DUF2007 domain-containing protein n=2 Tax=Proteus hauseri TaxID=183417 RepID=A0AAJ3HSB5_PROHU|nr:hypothetical protein [Proteus hauseri]OAT46873.1 hypothetical protein M997_1871 [Proteus hauseri ATCC 700826]
MWNIHPTRGQYQLLSQYLSPLEAAIEVGFLQSEGIDAILLDENIIWNNQMYAQAMGGVKLLVNQENFSIAQTMLNELQQGKHAINEQRELSTSHLDTIVKNNKEDYLNMFFVFLIFFVFGLAIPFKSQQKPLSNIQDK